MYLGIAVALLVIAISSFFDAVRDVWMRDAGWWKRHIPKWISFYTPMMYILYASVPFGWLWLYTVIGAWILWQLGMRYAGAKWESMWVRLIKKVF